MEQNAGRRTGTGMNDFQERRLAAWQHPAVGYAAAVVLVAALAGAKLLLSGSFPQVGFRAPYILTIGLVAYFFGRGPGVAALILSAAAFTAIFTPLVLPELGPEFAAGHWIDYGVFLVAGVVSLVAMTSLRDSRLRIAERTERLEAEVRERQRVEGALRESEERFRTLFSTMTEGFALGEVIRDDDGKPYDIRFLEVNPAFPRLTGISPEDATTKTVREILPGLESYWVETYGAVAETGQPASFINYSQDLDSWFQVYAYSPQRGRFAILFFDATERQRAAVALRESEAALRTVFDSVYDGILLHAPDGSILDANDRFLEMYGIDREEMTRLTIPDLTSPSSPLDTLPALWARVMDGEPQLFQWKGLRPHDGSEFDVEVYLRAIRIYGQDGIMANVRDVTERKRAEQALQESEERFRQLADAMPQLVWTARPDGRVDYYNERYTEYMGIRPLQDGGFEWAPVLHEDDREPTVEVWWRSVETGEPYQIEHRVQRADGTYRWHLSRGVPVRDDQGRVTKWFGTATDIHDLKVAEEALRESEEQLRERAEELQTVMDVAPVAIWVGHDPECREITGNRTANEFYEAEEGENVSATTTPVRRFFSNGRELAPEELPMQYAAAHNVEVRDAEFEVEMPSGARRALWGYASPLRDSEGGVRGAVAAFVDITERKRVEEALRESEERFRALADSISQLAWMTDETGWIFWYNKRWYDYTGTTLEEMEGWGWRKVHHPDHVQRVVESFSRSLETAESWEDTFPLRGRDGNYRWFLSRAVPIRDEQGKVVRWFGTNTDITELLETQEEVRRLNAELEQRVKERTAELETANRELEAFSYSVSHDLRAPLRAVDGFSDALLRHYRDSLDSRGWDYLQRVRAAAQRMGQLIDDILDLSRATRAEMRRRKVNLSAMAMEIVDDLRRSQPEREAEITVAPGLTVSADAHLLRIALQNLLDNAWKFTSRRDIARIEVGALERDGERVYYVKDNGAGFDPAYADKLFSPFQRLHTESEFPGTGIGLALVHRVIRRHGGRVWAEGAVDRGATFYFTLWEAAR